MGNLIGERNPESRQKISDNAIIQKTIFHRVRSDRPHASVNLGENAAGMVDGYLRNTNSMGALDTHDTYVFLVKSMCA
jgi:hypothetical protein